MTVCFRGPGLGNRQLFARGLLVFTAFCGAFFLSAAQAALPVRIGQNFTGLAFDVDSSAVPPDGAGAAGPQHYVEMVNGGFGVFDKSSGQRLQSMTDIAFWEKAGVTFDSGIEVTDPRVLYDPASDRWFAAMVDLNVSARRQRPNRFLLAVSSGSNPTNQWQAVAFTARPGTLDFADFPTLGIDSTGVYLSADVFDRFENPLGPLVVSIPKSSLLLSPPTTNGLFSSGIMSYGTRGDILQPAVTTGNSSTPEAILSVSDIGLDFQKHTTIILSTFNTNGTLEAPSVLSVPAYSIPINPLQPDGSDTLDDGDARISASVRRVGDLLYATHSTEVNNRVAIRWYVINCAEKSLVSSGNITDPELSLFYPSIAANEAGTVVIGCNGSSENTFISSFAFVGQMVSNTVTFGPKILLKAGLDSYQLRDDTGTSRWGDYSSTSVDPADPNRFWTVQLFPVDGTTWSTQISELIVGAPSLRILRSGEDLVLSWADTPGAQLQQASDLGSPNWQPVAQSVAVQNGQASVRLTPADRFAFFRLAL